MPTQIMFFYFYYGTGYSPQKSCGEGILNIIWLLRFYKKFMHVCVIKQIKQI